MTIHDSLHAILKNKELVCGRFYEVFFERCPAARDFFRNTNFNHQAAVLTMALRVMEDYHRHGYPAVRAYLKYIGHKHHRRDVPREMYPAFADALLATLRDFHNADWDDAVEREWRLAIEGASQVMFLGYQEAVHV